MQCLHLEFSNGTFLLHLMRFLPPENVDKRSPALDRDDRCDITEDARLDHPPREVSDVATL